MLKTDSNLTIGSADDAVLVLATNARGKVAGYNNGMKFQTWNGTSYDDHLILSGTGTTATFAGSVSSSSQISFKRGTTYGLEIGGIQSGAQYIGMGVSHTVGTNNYTALTGNNAAVNHAFFQIGYDGTLTYQYQAHTTDGTTLSPATYFTIASGGAPTFTGNLTVGSVLTINGTTTAGYIDFGSNSYHTYTGVVGTANTLVSGSAVGDFVSRNDNGAWLWAVNTTTLVMSLSRGGALITSGAMTPNGTPSDARLKENVRQIHNGMDIIKGLNGKYFKWNFEENWLLHGKSDAGLIAQEVLDVFPLAVAKNPSGYYDVRYERFIPVLVEAVKETDTEVEKLKKRVMCLETEVRLLRGH
jgi:hypothetical protein